MSDTRIRYVIKMLRRRCAITPLPRRDGTGARRHERWRCCFDGVAAPDGDGAELPIYAAPFSGHDDERQLCQHVDIYDAFACGARARLTRHA